MTPRNDANPPLPDLTLGERTAPAPQTSPAPSSSIAAGTSSAKSDGWTVGGRVLAPWEPFFLYLGVIASIAGQRAFIEFDDGDSGWIALDQLRPLALPVGQKAQARKSGQRVYFPGEIAETNGNEVRIDFDDGAREWLPVAALRFPCQPIGPTAEQFALQNDLAIGDKVWAPWGADVLFVGAIDRIDGDKVHIRFDDGDRGWVQRHQISPYHLLAGTMVVARRNRGAYFPAAILEFRENSALIQFDDGKPEWIPTSALAIPCQPTGPNAKPSGMGSYGSWIWIGVIVLLAVVRGCR